MRCSFWIRQREAIIGLLLFTIVGIIIGCGGGGGGGGGTNTTTSTNTTSTTTTATTTTGSTNGSLFPDQIFYPEADSTGISVFRIKPDGTSNTLFQDLPAAVPNAAINEAGNKFAFFHESDRDPGPGVDLIYDVWLNSTISTGAGAIQLTPSNADPNLDFVSVGSIQFTPDDAKVVFTAEKRGSTTFGVYVVNVNGTGLVKIGDGEEAQVNLAGTKLVITRVFSGAGEIGTMNLDGTGFARLTNNANEDFMPQWSKDGTQIVFSTDRNSGQFDVYRMNANGSSVTQLTNSGEDEYGPSLNGDGTLVAYVILSGDVAGYGIYKNTVGSFTSAPVFLDSAIGQQVYWTLITTNALGGRSPVGFGSVQLGAPQRPRLWNRQKPPPK
jgi:hypothetical protein